MHLEKPWGSVRSYTMNQTSSVRMITIEAGQETSEHFHQLRDEMLVVLDDGVSVKVGDAVHVAKSGDEFVVPAEQVHRIIGGSSRGRVLEVAYGYTTEDDNHRVADNYGRPSEPEW